MFARHATAPNRANVVRLRPAAWDDEALLSGIRAGHPAAIEAFVERYSPHVRRILARILGPDGDLTDLHQDVFVRALASLEGVRGDKGLAGWISIISVNVARRALERRRRRRWLQILPFYEVPEVATSESADDTSEVLQRTYAALGRLAPELRIAFSLRIIEGMELTEVAEACSVSLATIKRRISKAEAEFLSIARRDEVLVDWIDEGTRWSTP